MKFSALSFLAFTSSVAAWDGQVSQWNDATTGEGPGLSHIDLIDYGTGSTYSANTFYGWTISSSGTELGFSETSPGGYNFDASVWVTNDGCFNIDFQGAFGAGHGYCCGNPCELGA